MADIQIIDFWNSIESATKNPTEANFLDLLRQLDQSLESFTELPAAGDAIEQLAGIYGDRATAKFAEIAWLQSSQHEPIIPLGEFDRYVRQSCVLDLDRFTIESDHHYPEQRAAAPDRVKAEVLAAIIEDDPLAIAHDEDVDAWVNDTLDRVGGEVRSLSSLCRGRSIVQVWLSILLSEGKSIASRNKGDFYDRRGIIVVTVKHLNPTSNNKAAFTIGLN
jgi:hypothetical protein